MSDPLPQSVVIAQSSVDADMDAAIELLRANDISAQPTSPTSATPSDATPLGREVRITASDADKARALLETSIYAPSLAPRPETRPARPRTKAELADYAFRAVAFGLIFFPFLFYALYLVLKMRGAEGTLEGRDRLKARIATGFVAAFVLGPIVWIACVIAFRDYTPAASLRDYPHPEILWGKWVTEWHGLDGKQHRQVLFLRHDGTARYQTSDGLETRCSGEWGFKQQTLYLLLHRIQSDDPAWLERRGQIVGWRFLSCTDTALTLIDGPNVVVFLRPQQK